MLNCIKIRLLLSKVLVAYMHTFNWYPDFHSIDPLSMVPCFSTYTRKIGKAWSIWWCNRSWFETLLHISTHLPTQWAWSSIRHMNNSRAEIRNHISNRVWPGLPDFSRVHWKTWEGLGIRLAYNKDRGSSFSCSVLERSPIYPTPSSHQGSPLLHHLPYVFPPPKKISPKIHECNFPDQHFLSFIMLCLLVQVNAMFQWTFIYCFIFVIASKYPLWCYSCFTFETLNGHLKELFHGTSDMTKQVIIEPVHIM